jgi:hypothetical protein
MKPEEALVVVLNGDNTMFCQKKEEKWKEYKLKY